MLKALSHFQLIDRLLSVYYLAYNLKRVPLPVLELEPMSRKGLAKSKDKYCTDREGVLVIIHSLILACYLDLNIGPGIETSRLILKQNRTTVC